MKILEGKRLAAVFAAYIGMFSLYIFVPSLRAWFVPIAILVIFLSVAWLFWKEKPRGISARKVVFSVLMAVSVALSSVFAVLFVGKTEDKVKTFCDETLHTAEGYVCEVLYEEAYGASYRIALTSIDGEDMDVSANVSLSYAGGFEKSDALMLEGYISFLSDDGFYQKAKGVFLSIEAETMEKTGTHALGGEAFFEKIREGIDKIFHQSLVEGADFATALMTGMRDKLSGALRLAFTRIGISHLLAVSGLHLSIIVGAFDLFLRLLTVSKKKKSLILIVISIFFAFVCGLSASVVRAAAMLTIFYLSELFGERSDSVTSLFLAVFLILVFRPYAVYDMGLWLSFLSTFGILCVMPMLLSFSFPKKIPQMWQKILRFPLMTLGMTVTATFFTMPVTYLAFDGISLISPLANLVFVPLIQILLYLLVIFLIFHWIPVVSSVLAFLAEIEIEWISDMAFSFSSWENIYVSIRYPFVGAIILALIIGILLVLFLKKLHPAWIFGVFFSCALAFGVAWGIYQANTRHLTYLYLQTDGKSDVIGMVSGGKTVLIDISTGGYAMQRAAVQALPDFYECEVDTYILTHYHSYHANSLRKLSETIKIHTLLLPEPMEESDQNELSMILSALDGDVSVSFYQSDASSVLQMGDISLSLPEYEMHKRSSHPVITFSALIGKAHHFSYVGSSGMETFAVPKDTDVLILGANGPKTKHIFSPDAISDVPLLILSDENILHFTEKERLFGTVISAEDYDGYVRILFKGDG